MCFRYKFQDGEWSPAGRGEQLGTSIVVGHHDGVMLGSQWMRSPVHFERLKITNNPQDTNPSHVSYRPGKAIVTWGCIPRGDDHR